RDSGDLHVHDDLERFHVAADRVERPVALHAAGVAREPRGRARAGRRADDGGLGGDGAAGARAVFVPPALLHRRIDGRKRKGMIAAALLAATLWTAHPADGVEMHLSRDSEVNRL